MAVKLHKKSIEPHEYFIGSYEKGVEVMDELQGITSKGRKVNKLWQKLFNKH